jgi:transcriptional regulator with GAF, ATPase, and Fis domain
VPPPAEQHLLSRRAAADLIQALSAVSAADRVQSIEVALKALLEITGAHRGFLALRQSDGRLIFPVRISFGALSGSEPEVALSKTILEAAIEGQASIVTIDARSDTRFSRQPSVQTHDLRAVLAVPLIARGQPFGVLVLDNPLRAGAFNEEAQRSAEEFAKVIGPILERDLELSRVQEHRVARSARLREGFDLSRIVGQSDPILDVLEIVSRVAGTDAAVLVTGETGTGKELVAESIHYNSARRERAFVPVNCGALPADLVESELFGHERGAFTGAAGTRVGRFEEADGGTLFLDEIGELSLQSQAKLLRVLQDGRFYRLGASQPRRANVRLIAATNRDLQADVAAGRFRSDLLFRLDVIRIAVPPLRTRGDDVILLAQHFVDHYARAHRSVARRFQPSALVALTAHHWPGNVRELANAVERMVVLARDEEIAASALPAEVRGRASAPEQSETLKTALRDYKRRLVQRALESADGDRAVAAQSLGVHPKYLYQLLRELGL